MELVLAVSGCQGFLQIGWCACEFIGKKNDKSNLEVYLFYFHPWCAPVPNLRDKILHDE